MIKNLKTRIFARFPARTLFQSLLTTIAIAATFHLFIVSIVAVIKRSISYINPLDFLGLSTVFPEYRTSRIAALGGWLILMGVFFGVLYVTIHYHLYLSIIQESKMHKRFKAVSKNIKKKLDELEKFADSL
jgi:hypothetical protein